MARRRTRSSCARRQARCAGSPPITISRSRLACRAGRDHDGRMRAVLIACVLALLAVQRAAAEDGCRQFAWPVDRELELFSDGLVADVESESALPNEGVFSILSEPTLSLN